MAKNTKQTTKPVLKNCGRKKGSSCYTQKQLDIIKDAKSRGLSRMKILTQYPAEGFTEGGVAAVMSRMRKTGMAAPQMRKRQKTARTKATVAKVKALVDSDCSTSLGKICCEVGLK